MLMYLCVNLYVKPTFIIMHPWCVRLFIVGKLSIMPEFRTFSDPLKFLIVLKVIVTFLVTVPLFGGQHCSPYSSASLPLFKENEKQ